MQCVVLSIFMVKLLHSEKWKELEDEHGLELSEKQLCGGLAHKGTSTEHVAKF